MVNSKCGGYIIDLDPDQYQQQHQQHHNDNTRHTSQHELSDIVCYCQDKNLKPVFINRCLYCAGHKMSKTINFLFRIPVKIKIYLCTWICCCCKSVKTVKSIRVIKPVLLSSSLLIMKSLVLEDWGMTVIEYKVMFVEQLVSPEPHHQQHLHHHSLHHCTQQSALFHPQHHVQVVSLLLRITTK